MAGHSKWANIKHKKAANDSRKAVVFSKLARLITLAVIEGGGNPDPASNVKLRIAVERARGENMPKINIDRAIEKAAGPDSAALKEIVYEAFGPGGVGMLIVATTDNPNRTNSEVRMVLDKHGGKIAGVNAVAYMFEKCGFLAISKKDIGETEIFELADVLEADLTYDDHDPESPYELTIPYVRLGAVGKELGSIRPVSLEPYYKPLQYTDVGPSTGDAIETLLDVIEDLDDVDNAYSNYRIL